MPYNFVGDIARAFNLLFPTLHATRAYFHVICFYAQVRRKRLERIVGYGFTDFPEILYAFIYPQLCNARSRIFLNHCFACTCLEAVF